MTNNLKVNVVPDVGFPEDFGLSSVYRNVYAFQSAIFFVVECDPTEWTVRQ